MKRGLILGGFEEIFAHGRDSAIISVEKVHDNEIKDPCNDDMSPHALAPGVIGAHENEPFLRTRGAIRVRPRILQVARDVDRNHNQTANDGQEEEYCPAHP